MFNLKKYNFNISMKDNVIALGLFVFFGAFFVSFVVSSDPISVWINPKMPAPYGSPSAPITLGKFDQVKLGSIGVSGNFAEFGNTVLTGK